MKPNSSSSNKSSSDWKAAATEIHNKAENPKTNSEREKERAIEFEFQFQCVTFYERIDRSEDWRTIMGPKAKSEPTEIHHSKVVETTRGGVISHGRAEEAAGPAYGGQSKRRRPRGQPQILRSRSVSPLLGWALPPRAFPVNEAKAKGTDNYDRDLEDVIDRLIVECDRKIARALKRLEDDDAKAAIAISVSEVTQTPEVLELSKQIKEKLKEVDQFDLEGKTDLKIRAMEIVDELRGKRADKQGILTSTPAKPATFGTLACSFPDARTQEMINEKLKKAEDLGEQGMVDEAQKALEEAEALKKTGAYPGFSKYTAADVRITDQKLRVCDICGAFLSVYDSDRRLADHFGGKLHLGYMQIREKLAELQEERNKIRKVDRSEDRRSKERSKERDRESSRDRERGDSRDRGRDHDRRSRDRDRYYDRDRGYDRERDRDSDRSRNYDSRSRRRSRSRSRERSRDYDRHSLIHRYGVRWERVLGAEPEPSLTHH
ncbi:LUC7 related protein [Prunus dulcis]|uniref:LUC7 related protein n=1 Tax=Prunus dulcis TaxID=3755 RepID=A0A4Y1RR58_PRUDU|nr:LUC7 related protein [Prunus dulcis]